MLFHDGVPFNTFCGHNTSFLNRCAPITTTDRIDKAPKFLILDVLRMLFNDENRRINQSIDLSQFMKKITLLAGHLILTRATVFFVFVRVAFQIWCSTVFKFDWLIC